ncbi:MAG TPA: MobF family relaxase [Verrucomicrobiae bacterium]|nr:MobF family relaxase [Verrucomicrobiae bacterium]
MLRVVPHKSAAAAKQYYAEGLKREDYYSEGQEIVGKWHGKAAAKLGLTGDVGRDEFAALVENLHPKTGKQLTPRNNEDRIVGYDLNFHAPKSLSVLYALTGDKELLKAFRRAVADTMEGIEGQTATRVRKSGAAENRTTGNLIWSEFVHFTARPVGGIPDPHLHVHCFAHNATFDAVEGRWKAAKFREIKREAPYSEAVFHSRLTAELTGLGYGIERTKNAWEIKGIPASVIAKFSRRTAEIERLAHEKGITNAEDKAALGAATRENKRKGLAYPELLAAWGARLSCDEKAQISKVGSERNRKFPTKVTASEALDYASAKMFERNSVVLQNRLLAEAMRYGVGHTTPESIRAEFDRRGMIVRQIGEDKLCTSLDVLAEEVALINFVRNGRSTLPPLARPGLRGLSLSTEQRLALQHILGSPDQVTGVRGGAGTGKTTLMKEVVPAIEETGKKVFSFAPSAEASRGTLREAGFANADTVAHLLLNPKLQEKVRGNVIWIDEAGLLGVRDLWRVMEIAGSNTRIILTGDVKQHGPVARGDGLRLLQDHAGMRVVEITKIRRQERAEYKQAVDALAKGNLKSAFRTLDKMGAFIEIDNDDQRYRQLAEDYLLLGKSGHLPLVVSPTHAEADLATRAIRDAKREAGQLGPEHEFTRFHNLQWEQADRALPEKYQPGLLVQFHQNAKGINRGELFRVVELDAKGRVQIENAAGKKLLLPYKDAAKFQVFEERKFGLCKGDQIKITRNGTTADGRRINNGNQFKIEKINKKGQIILNTGGKLDPDHGHFTYGYSHTSFSSQGKTVRDVLIAQSEKSFVASSTENFYVSASRARESIRIYTDSKKGLQEAVGNSSTRMAGIELAGISEKDLSKYMSTEMGGRQWKDAIESRRGPAEARSFVENLMRDRKQDPLKKPDAMQWEGYIKMRRNLVGPDGKSRSRAGGAPGKSKPAFAGGGVSKTEERVAAAKEKTAEAKDIGKPVEKKPDAKPAVQKKPERNSRMERFRSKLRSAQENFKKVMSRGGKGHAHKPIANRPVKVGNATIPDWQAHTKKNEKRMVKNAEQQQKVPAKQVQKAIKAPAPPAPRRGK